ncbi:MAG: class I SAM-dependent methyltransferase [Thermoplasmata archaeon]
MPKSASLLSGVETARAALGDRRAAPNMKWLRALLPEIPESRIIRTLNETRQLVPLERTIRARHQEGGRAFYAQFRAPFELYALVRLLKPDHVVETGVSSGVSSAHFLTALRRNGRGTLHSIDRPLIQASPELRPGESQVSVPPGRSSGWAMPEALRAGWDLRIGASQQRLPELVGDIPSLGLFLHDSLHTPHHLTFELSTVAPKLTGGAVVLADNTAWTGDAFGRFARRLGVRTHRRGRSDLVGLRLPPSA